MFCALVVAALIAAPPVSVFNNDALVSPEPQQHSAFDRGQHVSRQRVALGLDVADNLTLGEFWTTSALYGLAAGPSVFGSIAQLDATTSLLLTPATLAASLGGAYYLTHQRVPVRGGVLAGVDYGVLAGYLNGLLIGRLIAGNETSDTHQGRWQLGSAWVLSTLGGAAGGVLAHHLGATTHDMAVIGSSTLWGAIAGLTFPIMFNANDGRAYAGAMLAGSVLGGGLGATLAATMNISRARTWVLDLGAIAGLSVAATIAANTHTGVVGTGLTLLAGEALGITSAALLSRHMAIPDARAVPMLKVSAAPLPVMHTDGRQHVVPGVMLSAAL